MTTTTDTQRRQAKRRELQADAQRVLSMLQSSVSPGATLSWTDTLRAADRQLAMTSIATALALGYLEDTSRVRINRRGVEVLDYTA